MHLYKSRHLSMVSHGVWHTIVSPGLRSLLWSMVGRIVNIGLMGTVAISPLHDPVTWYKITQVMLVSKLHSGTSKTTWKGRPRWTGTSCIVLEVPQCNLLTSMWDFVPCDRIMQRAYTKHNLKPTFKPCGYVWFPHPPGGNTDRFITPFETNQKLRFFSPYLWPDQKLIPYLKSDP